MEELLEKIDRLKKSLDNEDIVIRIRKLNKEIIKDKELINMIKGYKKEESKELREKIYSNRLYREYKSSETDLNLMIIGINNKLRTISNKGHCV